MRLLITETISVHDFQEPQATPEYAILSHRWRDQDISFQDIHSGSGLGKRGYAKVLGACAQAAKDGYGWLWIDTCCIDRTSSSELSDAISSNFAWYQKAEVCYAYLDDVAQVEDPSAIAREKSQFARSEWFTRGWTLQELIALASVVFFSKDRVEIGSKTSLASTISEIARIEESALGSNHTGDVSIARRMSWAARRKTTRPEDRAYSLMGLFGVSMPIIYGEGQRAFVRLQQEMAKFSTDYSLFAWKSPSDDQIPNSSGLLASSPDDFLYSSQLRLYCHGLVPSLQ